MNTESTFGSKTATTAPLVPGAAPPGKSGASPASASPSRAGTSSGTAGIANGQAAPAKMTPDARAYAGTRGLSASTLEAMRVGGGTASFRSGKRPAIFFPHFDGVGTVTGWKARAIGEKDFTSRKGGKYGFWNLDQALGSETIYVTEGELDACSLVEAGVAAREVISVPHGATEKTDDNAERGYAYVEDAFDAGLAKTKRFILVTDSDPPGLSLRADLARLLGPGRCSFVDFPAGIKDANEYLLKHGALDLLTLVENHAKPWPIAGLYRLSELPETPELTRWECGFESWKGKLCFAPGIVSITTGNPGHGKTSLMMQLWCSIAERYDARMAIASFETRAKPHHRRAIRSYFHRKPDRVLSDAERAEADEWNERHFLWLVPPDNKPTLRWVLDTAEAAVIRHDVRVLQIDPWNKLESSRPHDVKETDYIGQCLDEIAIFARQLNCHVQILAHPAKIDGKDRGRPPLLEDISGSKNWDNKCDLGLVVHRPKMFEGEQRMTDAVLFVRKTRYDELGHPCALKVNLNLLTGIFEEDEASIA